MLNGPSPLRRRRCLGWLALAALGPLAGCAAPGLPAPIEALRSPDGLVALKLADGVYAVPGAMGPPDAANLGRVGNAGFVVGPAGVVVIDTGASYQHGQALLRLIRSVTALPIRVALVTHTRPEFLFGGGAFREAGIPIRTHRKTAQLMAARCETCLKNLKLEVGEAPMAGTALYVPDQQFDAAHELDAAGRPLRVLYFEHSSGIGDIAVLDVTSGVLFAGGLADHRRIPDIQDSQLPPWHAALAQLRALRPRQVVPGHGAPGGPEVLGQTAAYLDALEKRARELAAAGTSLLKVPDELELPGYAGWDQYEIIHRRNASIAFLRFEREALFK